MKLSHILRPRLTVFLLFVLLAIAPGCTTSGYRFANVRDESRVLPGAKAADPLPDESHSLFVDELRLRRIGHELDLLAEELSVMQRSINRKGKEYFTSEDHDRIELALFRYLMLRETLLDISERYGRKSVVFRFGESRAMGQTIGFNAFLRVAYHDARLIGTFMEEEVVIAKLNEGYTRSDIPPGTYNKIFLSVTSIDNIRAVRAASLLHAEALTDPKSALTALCRKNQTCRELCEQNTNLAEYYDVQVQRILSKKSLLLPGVENRIRHSALGEITRQAKETSKDAMMAAISFTLTSVGRIRSPIAYSVKFSSEQVKQVETLMQPGDIALTASSGYMSNLFLPGTFKHGVAYIGPVNKRNAVGLTVLTPSGLPEHRREKYRRATEVSPVHGNKADLIEAVSEGVVFNTIGHYLLDNALRVVVLRPVLKPAERLDFINRVYSYLGDEYDFKFDFSDASELCCTELVYRTLNGCGPVRFKLTPQFGRMILQADDIVHEFLDSSEGAFELVLLAEEDPAGKNHEGRILTGDPGIQRLRELVP
jgi:hypothetical protein